MAGPFPGMDPYLETPGFWPGIHDSMIVYARDMLQPLVRPRYYVEVRERIYFESPRDVIYPNATIRPRDPVKLASGTATLAADDPIVMNIETRQRESFLEITAVASDEVVTVIEIISPANKYGAGHGQQEYRSKQDQVLASAANLVEIDLIRRGQRVTLASSSALFQGKPFDYLACVSRAPDRRLVEVYPVTIRERLPRVGTPLRAPDPDVVLDLPAIFRQCYENGDYRLRVDYNLPPQDALDPDDDAWADGLLRTEGLRRVVESV